MKSFRHLAVLLLLVGGALMIVPIKANPSPNQITTVKVGLLTPQTGTLEQFSLGFERAAQLAIDQLNDDSSINSSFQFELSIYDTGSGSNAVNAIQAAIGDGSHYIVGAAASQSTLAAAPIAVANKIPMISYASTSPNISTFDDHLNSLDDGYLWRTVTSDDYEGLGISRLAYDGNSKKMGILVMDNDWGQAHIARLKPDFEYLGGEVVSLIYFPEGTTNYTTQVDQLLDHDLDIITVIGFMEETAHINVELARRHNNIPVISTGVGAGSIIFDSLEGARDSMENTIVVEIGVGETGTTTEFREKYQTQYTINNADIFLEHTYDAVMAGALAITMINSTQGPAIIAALSNLEFDGASGLVSFNEFGDVTSGVYGFSEIRDGQFESVAIWSTTDGLSYTDINFMQRWRLAEPETSTVTVESTFENTIETTVTELSASLPYPFESMLAAIIMFSAIIVRRKKI